MEDVDDAKKYGSTLNRSKRIRAAANFLPEEAVKKRKAGFCSGKDSILSETIVNNPMAALSNPDMMTGMLKGNMQGMLNIMLFSVVGQIFSGFIIAKVPFTLGFKFKSILQQGFKLEALDPQYVSSMSWCFLLIFGLQGLMSLVLSDTSGMEEMMMMPGAQ